MDNSDTPPDTRQTYVPASHATAGGETPAPIRPITAREKLSQAVAEIRKQTGDENWDPLVKIAEIAEEAHADRDLKTALSAYQTIADRLYPKLKALEIESPNASDIPAVRLVRVSNDQDGQDGNNAVPTEPSSTVARFEPK